MKNKLKSLTVYATGALGFILMLTAFQFAPVAVARIIQQNEDHYRLIDLDETGRIDCWDCDVVFMFDPETGDVIYRGALKSTIFPEVPTVTPEPTVGATATLEPTPEPTITPTLEPAVTNTPTNVPPPTETPTTAPSGNGYFLPGITKIMWVGDSITKGTSEGGTVRYRLYNQLQAAGINNFDFVGPTEQGPGNSGSGWDRHNAAFNGWQACKFLDAMVNGEGNLVGNWHGNFSPDIVLIHYGTNGHMPNHINDINDIAGDDPNDPEDYGGCYIQVVELFRSVNPNTVFFVSKIAAHNHDPVQVQQYNDAVEAFAIRENTANSPVIMVDNWAGFIQSQHTSDGNHLNDAGAIKMAGNLFDALTGGASQGGAVVAPTETPTATPDPVISAETQEPLLIDPDRCVVAGQAGDIRNIYEINDGWWQSTYAPDFIENTSSPDLIPIVASEVTPGRFINMDHSLTWCLTPTLTGQHNIVLTVLAESNLKNDVFILINGEIFDATVGEKQSPKTSFAFDENTSNPKKPVEFYAIENEPMLVSFFPAETGFKLYSVRLSPVVIPPGSTPAGGYPEPVPLVTPAYPAPEV